MVDKLIRADDVSIFRRFSRTFTRQMGLLTETPFDPGLNLIESRIVFELAHRKGAMARDLSEYLAVNKGYLSRVLSSLKHRDILRETSDARDGRNKVLKLSLKGRKLFSKIDDASRRKTKSLLRSIGSEQSKAATEHLRVLEILLNHECPLTIQEVTLRDLESGDLGWVISRHGQIYFDEFGWNQDFEVMVSEIATGFIKSHDPKSERAWIAEARGVRLGCIFLCRENSQVAKLRILLVEPFARGVGVGSMLVKECVWQARQFGYRALTLWTNDVLASARKIYVAEGFTLEKEEPHQSFGKNLLGQYWSMKL